MWKMLSNDWCEIGKDKGVGIFQVKRQTPPFSTDPFILPATSRRSGYFVNIVWQSCICAITSIFSVFVPPWHQEPITLNRRVSGCSLKKFAGYKGNQLALNTRDKVPKLIKYLFSNLYLYLSQWAAVNSIWQLNWKGNINLTLEWNLQMADRTFGCQWPVTIGDGDDDGWPLAVDGWGNGGKSGKRGFREFHLQSSENVLTAPYCDICRLYCLTVLGAMNLA